MIKHRCRSLSRDQFYSFALPNTTGLKYCLRVGHGWLCVVEIAPSPISTTGVKPYVTLISTIHPQTSTIDLPWRLRFNAAVDGTEAETTVFIDDLRSGGNSEVCGLLLLLQRIHGERAAPFAG